MWDSGKSPKIWGMFLTSCGLVGRVRICSLSPAFGFVIATVYDEQELIKRDTIASLQIPYLLNVALVVTTYITAFPFSPKGTFAVLGKLDHAFSSLLKGE